MAADELALSGRLMQARNAAVRTSIEHIVDDGWTHEPLARTERKWGTYITECWKKSLRVGSTRRITESPANREGHRISLTYQPRQGSTNWIAKFEMSSRYVPPRDGWAVDVNYAVIGGDEPYERLRLMFDHNRQRTGELPASHFDFLVPDNSVRASARTGERSYEFAVTTIVDLDAYQRELVTAARSAKALRDLELKLCDELEEAFEAQLAKGDLVVIDWSSQKGGIPPREFPYEIVADQQFGPELTDKVRAELREGMKAQLGRRRDRWNAEADALHAAVARAFPALSTLTDE